MRVQRGEIEKLLQISTISFDGDMTLWDFRKVMQNSLKHTLVELQKQIPTQRALELTVDEMIAIRDQFAEEVKGEIWSLWEIRRRAFERTLEHVGHPDKDLAAHLNAIYRKYRYGDIELYPDVIPTFDALAPHFKLGLLSNGNTYPERCGLDGRFAFVVFSQDGQVEKPDPKIFQITAERAGCELTQMLHVGDSLKNDVAGAKNVGAPSIWLNREGAPNDTETQPDYEITSLTEIPAIVGLDNL
ncbi:MAG: HAD family hydrolase [Candidatus Poribacteria bacterium]|nr:HAD family hydrolase [Candidatus Poribacteria bacterium]